MVETILLCYKYKTISYQTHSMALLVECSISGCYIPKSLKQIVAAPLTNARQQVLHVTGPRELPYKTDVPRHSSCGTEVKRHCSMAMNAEYRLKFVAYSLAMVTYPIKSYYFYVKLLVNYVKPQSYNTTLIIDPKEL